MTKAQREAMAELEKAQALLKQNLERGTRLAKKTQKLLKDVKDHS